MAIRLDIDCLETQSRITPRRPSQPDGAANGSRLLWAGLVIILVILIAAQSLGPFPGAETPGAGAIADEPILTQAAGALEPALTGSHSDGPVSVSGGGSIQLIK